MHKRPIVNTRDEPHADSERYRRLHVIVGDANMSEYITALKVGTTTLVVDLIERDVLPEVVLKDPISAMKDVSRDQSRQWLVEVDGGDRRLVPSVEIQRAYLDLAKEVMAGRDEETDWVLVRWEEVLDALESDPMNLVGMCDWVTKKWLLDCFCETEGLSWDDPEALTWMQSQDLEYHNVDRESGLYYILESQGKMLRVVDDQEIASAMSSPPVNTRAYFRGGCLEKFGDRVKSINWDRIVFSLNGKPRTVDLKGLIESKKAEECNSLLDRSDTLEQLLENLNA